MADAKTEGAADEGMFRHVVFPDRTAQIQRKSAEIAARLEEITVAVRKEGRDLKVELAELLSDVPPDRTNREGVSRIGTTAATDVPGPVPIVDLPQHRPS